MDQIVVSAVVMATALLLAVANKSIVDFLAAPVRQKWPGIDLWFLVYVSLATGAAIAWFGEVNVFEAIVPNVLLGRILSCILVGGGASLIHDIFDKSDAIMIQDVSGCSGCGKPEPAQ